MEEMLRADIARLGKNNIYRVMLNGVRSPELLLIPEKLKNLGNAGGGGRFPSGLQPAGAVPPVRRDADRRLHSAFWSRDLNEVGGKALFYGLQALLETGRQWELRV